MSAINQYIDLYREHHDLIDANGAAPLNALRPEACVRLETSPLPRLGAENYQVTDLERILAPDYGINLDKVNMDFNPALTFSCGVPMLGRSPLMLANDTFLAPKDAPALPEGVTVGSLRRLAMERPDEVARFYGRVADLNNPIVALNTMLAQDGLYLHVAKGVRVEEPLQLVNILAAGMPLMAVRRLLIVLEENAECKLLVCDHTQTEDIDMLDLQTVEIIAGANSHFDYYELEESTEHTSRLSALYLEQAEGSEVTIDGLTLYNGTTRNEYYCRFNGENARLRLAGMAIEDRERRLSTYSHIDHRVPRCQSDELFKYSVDDRGVADFTGRIHVATGAVKTEAYQSNRNLVSTDTAKVYSKPQLEIYNDDVKCSHGSAVGQLDAMQLFYMRTRGLSEAEATLLLKQAFMADVIDSIRIPALAQRLHHLVACRFEGAESACAKCKQQ